MSEKKEKKPVDIMVDIETLGTEPGCIILSIGAVMFNRYGEGDQPIHEHKFYKELSMESQSAAGRSINLDTMRWWMEQGQDAKELFNPGSIGKVTMAKALEDLKHWMGYFIDDLDQVIHFWSKTKMDVVMLEYEMRQHQVDTPWTYWSFREMSSFMEGVYSIKDVVLIGKSYEDIEEEMNGHVYYSEFIAHNALHDAQHQAARVMAGFRYLRTVGENI